MKRLGVKVSGFGHAGFKTQPLPFRLRQCLIFHSVVTFVYILFVSPAASFSDISQPRRSPAFAIQAALVQILGRS